MFTYRLSYTNILQCFNWRYEAYAFRFAEEKTEDTFNHFYIWPFLQAVAKNGKIGFQFWTAALIKYVCQAEISWNHRWWQDLLSYKTDGLVPVFGKKKIKILLPETSGHQAQFWQPQGHTRSIGSKQPQNSLSTHLLHGLGNLEIVFFLC